MPHEIEHKTERVEVRHTTDGAESVRSSVTNLDSGLGRPLSPTASHHSHVEKHHTTYTHTDARVPQLAPQQAVVITSAAGLAQEIVAEGFQASAASVSSTTGAVNVTDSAQTYATKLKDLDHYREERDKIARKYEKEIEKMTEKYRRKTEAEAEKIRRELEKQHERDVAFREKLVEEAIARQKEEITLEAKYAQKELERQRVLAMDALERSRNEADIQVSYSAQRSNIFRFRFEMFY
uniref:CAHS 5b n=2 Tax=unclassified Macrobiotus TaxID=2609016 RepID=A0AAF0ARL7_9BILA|nr:CAHS 5b [Macrobiotus sp. 2 JF-2022a]